MWYKWAVHFFLVFLRVQKVADSGTFPVSTYKYGQIDRLNEVEHDVKLLCLKNFEAK